MVMRGSITTEVLLPFKGSSKPGEEMQRISLGAFGKCVKVAIFMLRLFLVISNVKSPRIFRIFV
jgi:hypothetical protein